MSNNTNWENILRVYDPVMDSKAQKEGFYGAIDRRYYSNLHMSQWYVNHPNRSYFEREFIEEYLEDREAYSQKEDIGVMTLFYLDFKYKK